MRLSPKERERVRERDTPENNVKTSNPKYCLSLLIFLQNSSRFILGFQLKLSHAPLQDSCPQNHKIAAFIKSVFRQV
jgi:hypothetical protein